eukprot:scaffold339461_cov36-Prasinocladus_malaysianus.AAC.1
MHGLKSCWEQRETMPQSMSKAHRNLSDRTEATMMGPAEWHSARHIQLWADGDIMCRMRSRRLCPPVSSSLKLASLTSA